MATSRRTRYAVHPALIAGCAAAVAGFAALPGGPLTKLQALMAGLCAQRPDHSYFLGGAQLPLEARMGGIFAGFLIAVLWLWWVGRERAGLLPPRSLLLLLLGFVALMAVDGTNALLYETGFRALYPPQNVLRLATGLVCGLAVGLLAVPVLSGALWRDWDVEPSLANVAELAGPLCWLGIVEIATISGIAGLLYPVALLMVVGALVAFAVGNTYALLLVTRAERQATRVTDALNPCLAGLLVSAAELAALAWLRGWAEATWGIRWVV